MTPSEIREQRQAYEDANYTKQIDCPEHPGQHKATLHTHGHRYAGIWECPTTGTSESHDHYKAFEDGVAELEVEEVETPDSHPDRSDGYTSSIYVCGGTEGCGKQLEGDPRQDAYEDMIDSQIDEAQDNV